jgi:hypothetical protein
VSGRNWQGIPDWLVYAVRWQHATAMQAGQERAGEDAVDLIAGKVLADDPEFARVIVSRYVRSLVAAPKPRKRGKPGEHEHRLARCARMSAEGKSLRAIGRVEGISHTRVGQLLAEWVTRLPEMDAELIRAATPLETLPVNPQPAGFTAKVATSDPNVISLMDRRPA